MIQMEPLYPLNQDHTYKAKAYIALGSNLGDRKELLRQAIESLHAHPAIAVKETSGLYETDPVGYTEQPSFLNMVIAIETSLEPLPLLRELLACEERLGRIRQIRWGPRTIDLDLLLYDNVRMDQEELTLPHPRMLERAFVLVPLNDVMGQEHPMQPEVEAAAQSALRDGKDGISLWGRINWRNESELLES